MAKIKTTSITVINKRELWQGNESGWAAMQVLDAQGKVIADGIDIVDLKCKTDFCVEAKMDGSVVYYGALFEYEENDYHNSFTVTVSADHSPLNSLS